MIFGLASCRGRASDAGGLDDRRGAAAAARRRLAPRSARDARASLAAAHAAARLAARALPLGGVSRTAGDRRRRRRSTAAGLAACASTRQAPRAAAARRRPTCGRAGAEALGAAPGDALGDRRRRSRRRCPAEAPRRRASRRAGRCSRAARTRSRCSRRRARAATSCRRRAAASSSTRRAARRRARRVDVLLLWLYEASPPRHVHRRAVAAAGRDCAGVARAQRDGERRASPRAPAAQAPRACSRARRRVVALQAIDRALSGFHSKVACGSGDAVDHAGAIRQLMRQAPAAARGSAGSNVSAAVPCLSAGDSARLLLEAAGGPNRWSINPQCAARRTLTHTAASPARRRASHPPPLPRAASWRSPTRAATRRSGTTG